jgi:hypothetical protein
MKNVCQACYNNLTSGEMRATILFLILLLCSSYVQAHEFIFKNGKRIQGSILYEDSSLFRIVDSTGIEMRLRKSELNLAAMKSVNVPVEPLAEPTLPAQSEPKAVEKRPVRVYTNRDVKSARHHSTFVPPDPESEEAWLKSLSRLEKDFVRLQGACRGAGAGTSKILRTSTYDVKGKKVKVTAYWADPANIEDAKQICNKAIQTEDALEKARKRFQEFKQRQQGSSSGR